MAFSRSVSASASMTPSSSSNSNSTIIPPYRYPNQNQSSRGEGLRVNTDPASRLRSNSALSPRPSPDMYISTNGASGSLQHSKPYHSSSSRSLSTSQLTPSPQSPNDHVALAVRGLRGDSPPPQNQRISPATTSNAPTPTSAVPISVSDNEEDPTLKRLRDALEVSSDEGDTLDLSRQDIRKISNEVVEMFRSGVGKQNKGVWRLALSYNSLRNGSIADSFARLSRLRYLNLKGNYLTQFPKALADMVALEILDLSKNRITAFPDQPGRLVNLKVLSLTNNKMYTLPSYLVDFALLKVFKVDQNPIEWPPREVLGSLAITEEKEKTTNSNGKKEKEKEEDLRPWIENMKSWMRQKSAESDRLLEQSINRDKGYRSDEPPNSASSESSTSALPWHQRREMPQLAMSSLQTVRPTLQPLRNDSDSSFDQTRPQMSARAMSIPFNHDSPGRAASPVSRINTSAARHERNPSALSCNSPLSASTISSVHSRAPSNGVVPPALSPAPVTMQQGHSRGASYTATQRMSANLTAKKSLPDLRQSHAKIISERRNEGQGVEEARPLGLGIAAPTVSTFKLPGKGSWVPDMIRSPTGPSFSSSVERGKILGRKGSADMLRRTSGDAGGEMSEKRGSQEGPLMDESRNSYFRRLSTLPVSTISKAIPPALLKFIDSIRGILFALTQLHSALRQYLVFAVNERIASVFARVMEPASNYMNTLINALDRFDSISRRHTPPVHAIRGVLDAAKENVAVFAKVVAVLRLQVPAFKGNDVRYTRTLLLMIYGSMAEVACSWQNMAPLLREIKPLLAPDIGGLAMRAVLGGQKMVPTGSLTGRTPISPIIERRESHSPPSVTKTLSVGNSPLSQVVDQTPNPLPIPTSGPVTPSWAAGRSRRQAGSFSSHDVERGMLMGSPSGPRSATGEQSMNGDSGQQQQQQQQQLSYLRHRPSESATIVLENQEEEEESDAEEMAPPIRPAATSIATSRSSPKMTPTTPPEIIAPSHQPVTMVPTTSQTSRRGLGHQPSSSSGSSHALSLSTNIQAQPQAHSGSSRKLSVDVRPPTPTSATLFDEDLLDVIETATDIAFTCWLKLAEDIGASTPPFMSTATTQSHAKSSSQGSVMSTRSIIPQDSNPKRPLTISAKHHTELLHLLSVAEQITASLRESLMGLRANPLMYSNTTLPDDAQAFIKTVVKVSGLVKIISTNHTFPVNVRQNLSRLTQATRECAILIQVSSLRPGNATPAPIPPASAAISVRSTSPYNRMDSRENSMEDLNSLPPSTASSLSNANSNYLFSPNHYNGSGNSGYPNPNPNPPASAGWEYQQHSQPPQQREGLRGLQLPSRQMALGRSRSANAVPAPPTITMGSMGDRRDVPGQAQGQGQGQPRSAQPSQVAF